MGFERDSKIYKSLSKNSLEAQRNAGEAYIRSLGWGKLDAAGRSA